MVEINSKSQLKRVQAQTKGKPFRVRALCWVEIEIDVSNYAASQHPNSQFELKLDAFREAVRPANEYGITIYRHDEMAYEVRAPRPRITPTPK